MGVDNALPAGVLAQAHGVAGTAGVVNTNGRLYGRSVYEGIVRRFKELAPGESLLGELDHPDWPYTPRLERTALRVKKLQLSEGRRLEFTAHVLDTPAGRTLHSLLQAGVPVNISTRGSGSLQPVEGAKEGESYHRVGSDYELHGIDAVVRGAHPGAHITACDAPIAGTPQRIERRETMQNLTEEFREEAGRLVMETPSPPGAEATPAEPDEEIELAATSPGTETDIFPSTAAAQAAVIGDLHGQLAERDEAIGRLQGECAAAHEALRQYETGGEVARVVSGLRPDLRRTVEGQLSGCATPAEVRERWTAIESVLGAAGLLREEPAGLGQSNAGDTPAPDNYTPLQTIQRRLLGRE